ncbi:PREDICTED: uncharacterized protein LOC108381839, partial [Rhagoletis zephyria]|uniref:uncharacterized protein LOC108381839 n=1 Tax=Rhagoletis zephyria TaxID=28612 RepID=UPI000811A26D
CTSQSGDFESNPRTTTDLILSDIRNAFKTVTNNTNLVNRMIPQMYEPVMKQSKFAFIFELPDANVKNGYSVWMMQRTDLVDPVFPNLTIEYMRAQLYKKRSSATVHSDNIDENISKDSVLPPANAWGSLGLDGWSGAIAPVNVAYHTNDKYPASDILMDLENETGYAGNIDDDGNIYIARVNDPFGTSVKWEQ